MKQLSILTVFLISLLCSCCKNDDDTPSNPIDQLPPKTMVGANTIGCLVNGEAFTDSGLMNNFYQLIDGEYHLGIGMSYSNYPISKGLGINTKRITLVAGQTYILDKNSLEDGDFTGGHAAYTYSPNWLGGDEYVTNTNYTGELTITHLDTVNGIISGTFWFDAEEITPGGEIIQIREGRFDVTYTN